MKDYRFDREYMECVSDILEHPVFNRLDEFTQHAGSSRRDHCIQVSYLAYTICKKRGLDYVSAARAGLLHDLFLYDWKDVYRRFGGLYHGFDHPKAALENAEKYFELNEKERNIILRHMFPLTLIPPRYAEGLVINYADERCCAAEGFSVMRAKMQDRYRRLAVKAQSARG